MNKSLAVLLAVLILTFNLEAKWLFIPTEQLVREADLIVVGTLHTAYEDSEGIGSGYINVVEIIGGVPKTLEGRYLRIGDDLTIDWADNWACAAGMHLRRQGYKGVWLLDVEKNGTVSAAYPGKFASLEQLHEIQKLLLKSKSKAPAAVEVQGEIKSFPPVPQAQLIEFVTDAGSADFDYSLTRALLTFLFAAALYFRLFRSRFRIR